MEVTLYPHVRLQTGLRNTFTFNLCVGFIFKSLLNTSITKDFLTGTSTRPTGAVPPRPSSWSN
jgi:hypothetical protein